MPKKKTLAELAEIQDANPNEVRGYVSGDPSFKFEPGERRYNTAPTWIDKRMYPNFKFSDRADDGRHKCDRCREPIRYGGTMIFARWVELEGGTPFRAVSHPRCWTTTALAEMRGDAPKAAPEGKADPGIGTKAWLREMERALAFPGFKVETSPVTAVDVDALASITKTVSQADANRARRHLQARAWLAEKVGA